MHWSLSNLNIRSRSVSRQKRLSEKRENSLNMVNSEIITEDIEPVRNQPTVVTSAATFERWAKLRKSVLNGEFSPKLEKVLDTMEPSWKVEGKNSTSALCESYWLEAVDKNHRWGGVLHVFHKEWLRSETDDDFFTWLDKTKGYRGLPGLWAIRLKGKLSRVSFLKPEESLRYQIACDEKGRLIYKDSKRLVHLPKLFVKGMEGIFVVDHENNFYMARKFPGYFHHSTFLAGGRVRAAGMVIVNKGHLKWISRSSGHYKPTSEQLQLAISLLKGMGLTDEFEVVDEIIP
ncbi:hypothetical protein K7432_010477 [Basidiobolus ranarum]|uniref:Uncharacterized protein n=1 Tax=Basidiobolus ranarum TaxID=34480 RepID=A0ABR2VVD7_9FUNG